MAEQQCQAAAQNQQTLAQKLAEAGKKLAAAEERIEHGILCALCMERPRDTILMPCMHFLYCSACMAQVVSSSAAGGGSSSGVKEGVGAKRCPSCRACVTGQVVAHLAGG